jgi:hypothetical protein
MWARNGRWILPEMPDLHVAFRDLLHAVNLRHGTDGFITPSKEDVLRIFSPWKIRRLRPGLNPRTWVPKASTLPLDHRSCYLWGVNINWKESIEGVWKEHATVLLVLCSGGPPCENRPVCDWLQYFRWPQSILVTNTSTEIPSDEDASNCTLPIRHWSATLSSDAVPSEYEQRR